jgi:antitoxin ChpS
MHKTQLRKVGGSVMLAVPPAVLEILELGPGAAVGLTVQNGRLIVEARPRRRYTLDELLAQCHPSARRREDDRQWVSDKPAGREIL